MVVEGGPGVPLHLVPVKDQHQAALLVALVVAENVHEPLAGRVQVLPGQVLQGVPGEDHVVTVHDEILLLGGRDGPPGSGGGGLTQELVLPAALGAEGPQEDGLQLLLVQVQVPGVHPGDRGGVLPPLLWQGALQVHVLGDLVPLHRKAPAVGAEDRVGGVLQVALRVIPGGGHHLLLVVAGGAGEFPPAPGVGGHGQGIVLHGGHRGGAGEGGPGPVALRGVEGPRHGLQVADGPAQLLGGEGEGEGVPGLQQHALGLHEALAHRPVSGLAEVAPLGVLGVGPAGEEGDAQVGDGGAGEDPPVGPLGQVGEDEPLPVPVQQVLAAPAVKDQTAALGQGLQEEMDLGVVAQGLKVAHPLHRGGDGLLVQNAPGVHLDRHVKAVGDQALEDLDLHLAHEAGVDLLAVLVPDQVELGVLLLQLPELGQQDLGWTVRGEDQAVGDHRLQQGGRRGGLGPQALAGVGLGEPQQGAHLAGGNRLRGLVLGPGVQAQLGDLFLQHLPARLGEVGQGGPDGKGAPGELGVGQAVALAVPGDLKDPGGEVRGIDRGLGVVCQALEKVRHPLQPEGRAEVAGEEPAQADQPRHVPGGQAASLQVPVQQPLVPEGHPLGPGPVPAGEVGAPLVQLPLEPGQDSLPAGVGQVHLGDKEEGGDLVAPEQPPQGLRVGLDPVGGADDQDGVVQHLEGALHLGGEVHMAGGVQEGDRQRRGLEQGLLGEDGDAPVPLQGVGVQIGVPVVHPSQGGDGPGGVEQGLGQGGFPRVHVGQNADDELFHGGSPLGGSWLFSSL